MAERIALLRAQNRNIVLRAIPCGLALSIAACCELADLKNDNSGIPFAGEGNAGFFAPYYLSSTNGAENSYTTANLTDQNALIKKIIARDPIVATLMEKYAARSGQVILDEETVVSLTEVVANPCPAELASCNETSSDKLGVAPQALIESLETLTSSPRNQGERGTCMAFAMSAAAEILLRRNGTEVTLSPQNAYFVAKRATNTWDVVGLPPMTTMQKITATQEGFVEEKFWPYNPVAGSCEAYNTAHPNFVCSATEVQGGGDNGRTQEPQAASASQFKVVEAHQLYASLGRIKQALYRGYPVILSANANTDFNAAGIRSGVISWVGKQANCGETVCGHAFLAVGYQDDESVPGGGYLIVKNSWGTKWGVKGVALASYEWALNSILDAQALVRVEAKN
jgi:C1A family cysteine protease